MIACQRLILQLRFICRNPILHHQKEIIIFCHIYCYFHCIWKSNMFYRDAIKVLWYAQHLHTHEVLIYVHNDVFKNTSVISAGFNSPEQAWGLYLPWYAQCWYLRLVNWLCYHHMTTRVFPQWAIVFADDVSRVNKGWYSVCKNMLVGLLVYLWAIL